jgi:anti-sigma factor RsiW
MNAYSYDAMKYEVQQHANRLADEAVAERLARRAAGEKTRKPLLGRIQLGWAARLAHPVTHVSRARIA